MSAGQPTAATPPLPTPPFRLVLVRHGATAWTRSGRHTGRTDLSLDEGGRVQAARLGPRLAAMDIDRVLTSPLQRARVTCELAGLGSRAELADELAEWDYGVYEGLTTDQIRERRPGWHLFEDGCPNGEAVAEVGARVDGLLARLSCHGPTGTVALFAHGHVLRVLAARWLGLAAVDGRLLMLGAGSLSVLGHERDVRVIEAWNT